MEPWKSILSGSYILSILWMTQATRIKRQQESKAEYLAPPQCAEWERSKKEERQIILLWTLQERRPATLALWYWRKTMNAFTKQVFKNGDHRESAYKCWLYFWDKKCLKDGRRMEEKVKGKLKRFSGAICWQPLVQSNGKDNFSRRQNLWILWKLIGSIRKVWDFWER